MDGLEADCDRGGKPTESGTDDFRAGSDTYRGCGRAAAGDRAEGERWRAPFEQRSLQSPAERARLQQIAAAGRGHDDGHQRRGEFYATICGEWATRGGDRVCDGWRDDDPC